MPCSATDACAGKRHTLVGLVRGTVWSSVRPCGNSSGQPDGGHNFDGARRQRQTKPQRRSRQQSTPSSIGSGTTCCRVAPGTTGAEKENLHVHHEPAHDHRLHWQRRRSSLLKMAPSSLRSQSPLKKHGRTPPVSGRAEPTGTGLSLLASRRLHANTTQRLVCHGAGHIAHT
jgi:hypothetical protein